MPACTEARPRRQTANLFVACVFLPLFGLAACATQQELVKQREDNLSAAGFTIRPANTPEREAMLKRLPANHFVRRIRGDEVTYVYADPVVCGCLYVGTQQAYNAYRLHMQQRSLADEQQRTADTYADPTWNWGAWGASGPGFGPEFGGGFGW